MKKILTFSLSSLLVISMALPVFSAEQDPAESGVTTPGSEVVTEVPTTEPVTPDESNQESVLEPEQPSEDNTDQTGGSEKPDGGEVPEEDSTTPPQEGDEGNPDDPQTPPTPAPTQPTNPVTPRPQPRPTYPPQDYRQPSNRPSEVQVVEPETSLELVETTEELEVEEEINLLEGEFITFNANIFETEEEADDFITMIEEDEETKDRFEVEKEVVSEEFVLVRVSYKEDQDEKGRYILFYVATEFEDEDEGQEYIDQQLLIYPDLFVAGEVIQVGESYDVIFGIRPSADTQAITYDEETFELDYRSERKEYTYRVKADPETGQFLDEIQPAVEEAFPGEFTFESELISDVEKEVTMIPVPKDDQDSEEEESTLEEEVSEEA